VHERVNHVAHSNRRGVAPPWVPIGPSLVEKLHGIQTHSLSVKNDNDFNQARPIPSLLSSSPEVFYASLSSRQSPSVIGIPNSIKLTPSTPDIRAD
jgi:hypothetical protein